MLDTYTDGSGVSQTRELAASGGVYTIENVTEDHSIHVETKQAVTVQIPGKGVSLAAVEAYLPDGTEAGLAEMAAQGSNQRQYLVDEGAYVRLTLQVAEQYRDQSPVVLQAGSPLSAQGGESPRVYVYTTNVGITRAITLAVQEVQKNTYKVSLPAVEGGLIQEMDGYNANAVVSGESYQFKLTLEEAYQNWQADPKSLTLAMAGRHRAGLLQLDPRRGDREKKGYISFLYLTPQQRHNGVGVQLIGKAVSLYRPLGREDLQLSCSEANQPALSFYEKYGFRRTGSAAGAYGTLYELEKPIGYHNQAVPV